MKYGKAVETIHRIAKNPTLVESMPNDTLVAICVFLNRKFSIHSEMEYQRELKGTTLAEPVTDYEGDSEMVRKHSKDK